MKIDGGCHCGAINFEAEVDPSRLGWLAGLDGVPKVERQLSLPPK